MSHYVEKVRWSLDRLGVDYEEEHDAGYVGLLLLGRDVSGRMGSSQRNGDLNTKFNIFQPLPSS